MGVIISFPRPTPRRTHLRGAPVAEFVGDGLDAPSTGHRDVAALGAHVQPHHRHDWLVVCLRPESGSGSGSASSGSCAQLPRGPTASRSLGAPASPGQQRLAEGSPGGRRRRFSAGRSGLDQQPLAPRCAPQYRPKRGDLGSTALSIALIRSFQNLRHLLTGASTGPSTCHFRFLLLEPSRKILPNEALVPAGMTVVAMAQQSRSQAIGSACQATAHASSPPSWPPNLGC